MERQFIEHLRERLPSHPQLLLGVGDDAAILRLAQSRDCVVTSDLLAEGTHFVLPIHGSLNEILPRVGRKALAVNLSDLAAMSARPLAAVISLLLPKRNALTVAEGLYDGLLPLAEEFRTAIAGGDTNCWDGPLVISVTAIGETTSHGPLRRDGAQPGDAILVTGDLGGSSTGKHLDFTPRVREALLLHQRYDLHAGMDISDGISLDLARLCQASGCGALLQAAAIPISDAARAVAAESKSGRTPVEHALSDGEDFELLLTAPASVAEQMLRDQPLDVPITRIGQITEQAGVRIVEDSGAARDLAPAGYEHGS